MKPDMKYAPIHRSCFGNEQTVKHTKCGCFNCLSVFHGSDITRFKEEKYGIKTALCPLCGYDTVLPNVTDIDLLDEMKLYFLTPIKQQ